MRKEHLWVKKIILWPRNSEFGPKEIGFKFHELNIIYGDSRTGKSALIPIVDYCLCSSDCRIPADVIRLACGWFGVLLQADEEEILVCRQEPGSQQATGDMYFARGKEVRIPKFVIRNTNIDDVKNELNQALGITDLRLRKEDEPYGERPSLRDEAAFLYQPQSIIANSEALFYKLDKLEHKKRLVNAFPYFLGSITEEQLLLRNELDGLDKRISSIKKELLAARNYSKQWMYKIESEIVQAVELGLSEFPLETNKDPEARIAEIERIAQLSSRDSTFNIDTLSRASSELLSLEEQEKKLSLEISQLQSRRYQIDDVLAAYKGHDSAVESVKDYLNVADWLRGQNENGVCPFCGSEIDFHSGVLKDLVEASERLGESQTQEPFRVSLGKERAAIQRDLLNKNEEIRAVKFALSELVVKADDERFQREKIDQFIGRLKASYGQYKEIMGRNDLQLELDGLERRNEEILHRYNERAISCKTEEALGNISELIHTLLESGLDAEHADWRVGLDIKNLLLRIEDRQGVKRYLNEIGSASNWLAYHMALSLALQYFFQSSSPVNVPAFLMYDQPSQVYFPHESEKREDKDVKAVKNLIHLLANLAASDEFPCQIILMEHAGEGIWGNIENINIVSHWREEGEKLVPQSWEVLL